MLADGENHSSTKYDSIINGIRSSKYGKIMQEHLHTISCILFRVDITPIDTYLL